jgi:TPR repeat protein
MMKNLYIAICIIIFAGLQITNAHAKELEEYQAEAAQFYEAGDYKKAYKAYYKLAKVGDHKSQYWVAVMYALGEGKKVSLKDAYGWSALAAESGNEKAISKSQELLKLNGDPVAAQKRADKLMKKYGNDAQEERARMVAKRESGRRSGACTGSRLTCERTKNYENTDFMVGGQAVKGVGN